MFNKSHYSQLTNSIEREDYLNLTIIGPATSQIKQQINGMNEAEKLEALKTYNVHYQSALEARMIAIVVRMRFRLYGITVN